jgi:hypothetical protein
LVQVLVLVCLYSVADLAVHTAASNLLFCSLGNTSFTQAGNHMTVTTGGPGPSLPVGYGTLSDLFISAHAASHRIRSCFDGIKPKFDEVEFSADPVVADLAAVVAVHVVGLVQQQ